MNRTDSVIRYVQTFVNNDGMRTLVQAAQGRFTYATAAEAQAIIDAWLQNSPDLAEQFWGGTLEVRPVECYPGHFDPMYRWFDDDYVTIQGVWNHLNREYTEAKTRTRQDAIVSALHMIRAIHRDNPELVTLNRGILAPEAL